MNKENTIISFFLLGGSIILISALHFLTPIDNLVFHQIYQRLYYIPIILAAFWYGLRGGLGAAFFACICYLPHIAMHWQYQNLNYALNQYAELGLFLIIGAVTGWLGDQKHTEHERAEKINSELQTAYADLRHSFNQLLQAEKLSSLAEIASGVVHEVRNPLAAIKGAVEILEDELAETSPRREFAAIAKAEVERIDKLVTEFLQFARAPKPEKTPSDINELINSVRRVIGQQARRQNVTISENLAESLPLVWLDNAQIGQVLLNLALNALQVMPTGGEIAFATFAKDALLVIEIADTGSGIDEQNLLRIFDPFFSTKEKNLGLGLSIAYKIMAEHGGRLSAENTSDGAVFRLEFPQDEPKSSFLPG